MEFEWKIFPGFTTFGLLQEIQKSMEDRQCEPEQFDDSIIFTSMFNDIVCGEKGNAEKCEVNWSFLGLGSEKKWYGTYSDKPVEFGIKLLKT